MCSCTCMCMYVSISVHACVVVYLRCIYIYVCICVCVYVCMYICTRVCISWFITVLRLDTGIYCVCTNVHVSAYVTRGTEVYLSGHTCVGVADNRLSIVCRAHAFVVVVSCIFGAYSVRRCMCRWRVCVCLCVYVWVNANFCLHIAVLSILPVSTHMCAWKWTKRGGMHCILV